MKLLYVLFAARVLFVKGEWTQLRAKVFIPGDIGRERRHFALLAPNEIQKEDAPPVAELIHNMTGTGSQGNDGWIIEETKSNASSSSMHIFTGEFLNKLRNGLPTNAPASSIAHMLTSELIDQIRRRTPILDKNMPPLVKHLQIPTSLLIVPVLLGFALLVLMLTSFLDFNSKSEATSNGRKPLQPWSMIAIVALTSYRFYTGFLSATWMPYLLAMEGHQLMEDRQSFFMGTAKLIYGFSILLNPIFGLFGDQIAIMSHWSGRRLFILVGVGSSGLGIYGCLVAAEISSTGWYLTATVLWMLGEAIADVTTETLVPELLPRAQYEVSSSIRALNFLLGGLTGYTMLIVFRHQHYSWLYYGYLILMLLCAFLTLIFIGHDDTPTPQGSAEKTPLNGFFTTIVQAYTQPMHYEGGFPRACLCLFIFSLGSAPMFFLLLMVRDLVGIKDQVVMQMHFSIISIVFFIAAAVASTLGAASSGASEPNQPESPSRVASGPEAGAGGNAMDTENAEKQESQQTTANRWRMMELSTIAFGVVAACIPLTAVPQTVNQRISAFYGISALFGMAFGSVYARFQECTWSILPPRVDVANAMGFAAMSKLAGVGLGNFVAGIILDLAATGHKTYSPMGYVVMCLFCSALVFSSAYLIQGIPAAGGKQKDCNLNPK